MEMTIKQLASELGVSKPTVRSVIAELGFQGKLRKVGNRYMLSDMQISEIKLKMSNRSESEVQPKSEKTEKSESEVQPKSEKTEKSESEVQLKSESEVQPKTENNIFMEQLLILNKQLAVKDEQITMLQDQFAVKDRQINLLQEQISQLTAAMENLTASLNAEQALHAGTIQKQLTEHSVMDQPSDVDQSKQRQGFFSRLFGRN